MKTKAAALSQGTQVGGDGGCPEALRGEVRRVEAAVAERWSVVGSKAHQRWLWPALEHRTGVVLASVVGSRADEVFLQLPQVLKPFGLVPCSPEAAGVDNRPLPTAAPTVGKVQPHQSARNQLTLRTRRKRRARKTSCFSKSVFMPDTVIGLLVKRYEFGTLA